MKKILITGATGFIGSRLYQALSKYNPIGITRQDITLKRDVFIKCDLIFSIRLALTIFRHTSIE